MRPFKLGDSLHSPIKSVHHQSQSLLNHTMSDARFPITMGPWPKVGNLTRNGRTPSFSMKVDMTPLLLMAKSVLMTLVHGPPLSTA